MFCMELLPNSTVVSRAISTLDVLDEGEIPPDFTGRVRVVRGRRFVRGLVHERHARQPGSQPPRVPPFPRRRPGEIRDVLRVRSAPGPERPGRQRFARLSPTADSTTRSIYRDGKRNDAGNGNPAVSKWRADGTLRHQLRYRNGKRVTGRH